MFEELSLKLESVFKKIRGEGRITESNVAESLREIRRVLLDADVNFKVTKEFIDEVQRKALGQEVLLSITPGQLIVKIFYDELVRLMGETKEEIKFSSTLPSVILIAGLQGSGKTTFSGKLARYLKRKGKFPLLVASDVYRPAAIDQLMTLGKQIDIPVFAHRELSAIDIATSSIEYARKTARDTVIIDTAGRLHIDEEMMQEIETIKQRTMPSEILFVVDSMTGQDAVNTAKVFHERLAFDGIVLTKLDGDTRGGAALSIRRIVSKPIKFISNGEKLDALEQFYPERMASRILGMGDVVTLVEKVQEQVDETKAQKLEEKIRKSSFTFEDFLEQLQEIKKMGPLQNVLKMLPGMNRISSAAMNVDDGALKYAEAIICSMTREERLKPHILNGNRRKRIAKGSGTTIQEVNRVLKQFSEMQQMMKTLSKGKVPAAFRKMGLFH
ncbi:MAG: signal recognition particle protein [Ignavibacteria bacterium]|nr:signal recognition particle protein [Ignavibacteria bacterium]